MSLGVPVLKAIPEGFELGLAVHNNNQKWFEHTI